MPASPEAAGLEPAGLVVIRRLHRMVRQGYRPWLGYDAAGGEDRAIVLHIRGGTATLAPDGGVSFSDGPAIAAADAAGFDARFPPDRPNRRNLVRRLYEMGF